jgi:hypothetical protein
MSIAPQPDFSNEFAGLRSSQQAEVMNLIRRLKAANQDPEFREKRRAAMLALAGSISHEDIQLMMAAIEEDCGRIDNDSR